MINFSFIKFENTNISLDNILGGFSNILKKIKFLKKKKNITLITFSVNGEYNIEGQNYKIRENIMTNLLRKTHSTKEYSTKYVKIESDDDYFLQLQNLDKDISFLISGNIGFDGSLINCEMVIECLEQKLTIPLKDRYIFSISSIEEVDNMVLEMKDRINKIVSVILFYEQKNDGDKDKILQEYGRLLEFIKMVDLKIAYFKCNILEEKKKKLNQILQQFHKCKSLCHSTDGKIQINNFLNDFINEKNIDIDKKLFKIVIKNYEENISSTEKRQKIYHKLNKIQYSFGYYLGKSNFVELKKLEPIILELLNDGVVELIYSLQLYLILSDIKEIKYNSGDLNYDEFIKELSIIYEKILKIIEEAHSLDLRKFLIGIFLRNIKFHYLNHESVKYILDLYFLDDFLDGFEKKLTRKNYSLLLGNFINEDIRLLKLLLDKDVFYYDKLSKLYIKYDQYLNLEKKEIQKKLQYNKNPDLSKKILKELEEINHSLLVNSIRYGVLENSKYKDYNAKDLYETKSMFYRVNLIEKKIDNISDKSIFNSYLDYFNIGVNLYIHGRKNDGLRLLEIFKKKCTDRLIHTRILYGMSLLYLEYCKSSNNDLLEIIKELGDIFKNIDIDRDSKNDSYINILSLKGYYILKI